MSQTTPRPDQLADLFVTYLFKEFRGARHVRRVASWIGFIVIGIDRVAKNSLARSTSRQVVFEYGGRRFKAKYNHKAGPRGGIDIVEVLPGRGSPEGDVAVRVTSLRDAELVYASLARQLDSFIER